MSSATSRLVRRSTHACEHSSWKLIAPLEVEVRGSQDGSVSLLMDGHAQRLPSLSDRVIINHRTGWIVLPPKSMVSAF